MEEIMESEETKDDKETEDIKPLGTWYYNGNFYHDGYAVESIWGKFLHILSCEKIETKKVIDKSYKDELDLTQYGTEIRVINIQWKKRYSIDAVVKLWSVQYLISHLTDEDKEDLHNRLRDEAAENKRKSGEYFVKEEVFVEKALRCEGYSDSVRSHYTISEEN
jgi:hypothetical protein